MSVVAHRFVLLAEDYAMASAITIVGDRVIDGESTHPANRALADADPQSPTHSWTPIRNRSGETCARGEFTQLSHLPNLFPAVKTLRRGVGGKAAEVTKAVQALALSGSDEVATAAVVAFDSDTEASEATHVWTEFQKLRDTVGRKNAPLPIVLALAHQESEAWWFAGFVPTGKHETSAHADVCRELHFDPVQHAHKLKSASSSAPRKCKETFVRLAGDPKEDRALRCLEDPPLDTLTKHGAHSGLARYIEDVRTTLCPALAAR